MTKEAYDQVCDPHHKGHLSHDVIAAAAAWEAAKAWDEHKRKNGQETSHTKAKEFLAAAGAAFITHIAETKGLDAIDSHKAKAAAKKLHDEQVEQGRY